MTNDIITAPPRLRFIKKKKKTTEPHYMVIHFPWVISLSGQLRHHHSLRMRNSWDRCFSFFLLVAVKKRGVVHNIPSYLRNSVKSRLRGGLTFFSFYLERHALDIRDEPPGPSPAADDGVLRRGSAAPTWKKETRGILHVSTYCIGLSSHKKRPADCMWASVQVG